METRTSLFCLLGLLLACGSDDASEGADLLGGTTGASSTTTESSPGTGPSESTDTESGTDAGEGDSSSSAGGSDSPLPRALMARFDATGDIRWSDVAPEVPSSALYGVRVDESGFFAVGSGSVVARYDSEGTEQWRLAGRSAGEVGTLHDVLLVDGVVYAVGETGGAGWLVAISDDGQLLWSEVFDWTSRVSAGVVTPAPDGGVLVVGHIEQGGIDNPDFAWVLPCDSRGCDAEPLEAGNVDRLYGFALDGDGGWVVNSPRRLVGRSAGESEPWFLSTDFVWSYHVDHPKLLAIDSGGAIVVAGGDPADLLKLAPAGP